MGLLEGKKALVTGGSSGIGKAIALAYVKEGAHVAIFGTNKERLQASAEELQKARSHADQKIWFASVDVSQLAEVKTAVDHLLEAWGNLDILVNNAGITRDQLLMKMSEEDWDEVLRVNLKSVYNLCHTLIRPMMKAKSGKIINVSSVIGLIGNPGQTNYAASKLGMVGFTRSLAKEVASRGICVNCIAPGFIQTKMTDALNEKQREGMMHAIPMKRLGTTQDVADVAIFLASLCNYVTGQVIAVDGGMTA